MKKIMSIVGIMSAVFILAGPVLAQGMMEGTNRIDNESDDHTAREEAEGRAIFAGLQTKETTCEKLTESDFGALGEYYMGTMLGSSHEAMNVMMERMMGRDGEEAMHIVMGKRLSGCDMSVALPSQSIGFMPMMSILNPNTMMNFGFSGASWFGWFIMILWWALIIIGIVALVKWLAGEWRRTPSNEKKPLEILKERYAKGEIDNKEFGEKKKNLLL